MSQLTEQQIEQALRAYNAAWDKTYESQGAKEARMAGWRAAAPYLQLPIEQSEKVDKRVVTVVQALWEVAGQDSTMVAKHILAALDKLETLRETELIQRIAELEAQLKRSHTKLQPKIDHTYDLVQAKMEAQLKRARYDALEEAAVIVESADPYDGRCSIAAAIRALIEKEAKP